MCWRSFVCVVNSLNMSRIKNCVYASLVLCANGIQQIDELYTHNPASKPEHIRRKPSHSHSQAKTKTGVSSTIYVALFIWDSECCGCGVSQSFFVGFTVCASSYVSVYFLSSRISIHVFVYARWINCPRARSSRHYRWKTQFDYAVVFGWAWRPYTYSVGVK